MDILDIFKTQSYVEIDLGTAKAKVKLDNKNFPHATAYNEHYSIAKFDFLLIERCLQELDLKMKEIQMQKSTEDIDYDTFLTKQTFKEVDTETGKTKLWLNDESCIEALYKDDYYYISKIDFLIIGASLHLLNRMP